MVIQWLELPLLGLLGSTSFCSTHNNRSRVGSALFSSFFFISVLSMHKRTLSYWSPFIVCAGSLHNSKLHVSILPIIRRRWVSVNIKMKKLMRSASAIYVHEFVHWVRWCARAFIVYNIKSPTKEKVKWKIIHDSICVGRVGETASS